MGTVKDMLEYKLDYAESMLEVEGISSGGGMSHNRQTNRSSPLQPSQQLSSKTSLSPSSPSHSASSSEKDKKTQQILEQSMVDHSKVNSSISRTFRSNDSSLHDQDDTPRPSDMKKFRAMSVSLNARDLLSFTDTSSPSHPSVATAAAAAAAAAVVAAATKSEPEQLSDVVALPKIGSTNSLASAASSSSTNSSNSNLALFATRAAAAVVDSALSTAAGRIHN